MGFKKYALACVDMCRKTGQKIYSNTQQDTNQMELSSVFTLIKVSLLLTVKGYNQIWEVSLKTATSCFH